ncbi:pyridoxamine 5'-phosphate oxidase family protein [Epibacterium ulvae]|uniref:pyridoxamine 5'-phosphate oxidase family protein n=1 Tax=Epibacterium ulvae TaxID=1156985 RepID=UPI0024918DDA|nr:pyridoxamine 5'-phosphate oxidase family protein [Epibacterium ulvae]
MPTPEEFYTDAQRALQEEGQQEKLAQVVVHAIVRDELEEIHTDYITSRDYFFLSSVNSKGEPTVSYKGGDVGFVKVLSNTRLIFPNYDGNGMWYSLGNIDETAKVGMLFMDMVTPWRIRVQGTAKLNRDPELIAQFPGANMVVDIEVDRVFQNCARYIHKHTRVEQSPYVPDAEGNAPYPAWKRIEPLQPFLHPDDQGRAAQEGGTISEEEYLEKVQKGTS